MTAAEELHADGVEWGASFWAIALSFNSSWKYLALLCFVWSLLGRSLLKCSKPVSPCCVTAVELVVLMIQTAGNNFPSWQYALTVDTCSCSSQRGCAGKVT